MGQVDIMEGQPLATVDVREMLCAQALAQAEAAMRRLRAGEILEILYNADDVKKDLLAWAKALDYPVLRVEDRPDEARVWIQQKCCCATFLQEGVHDQGRRL